MRGCQEAGLVGTAPLPTLIELAGVIFNEGLSLSETKFLLLSRYKLKFQTPNPFFF